MIGHLHRLNHCFPTKAMIWWEGKLARGRNVKMSFQRFDHIVHKKIISFRSCYYIITTIYTRIGWDEKVLKSDLTSYHSFITGSHPHSWIYTYPAGGKIKLIICTRSSWVCPRRWGRFLAAVDIGLACSRLYNLKSMRSLHTVKPLI